MSFAGVLRSAITVEHQVPWRPAQVVSHDQRSQHQAGRHGSVDRPTHDTARVQIHDNGQIHPTFTGAAVRHVTGPNLVWTHRVEVLIQQVVRYAIAVFALGGYFVSHPLRHTQTHSTHQPANSVSTNFKAFRAKCLHHFPTAQIGSARLKQLFDPAAKLQLLGINQLARAFAPVVVSRLADLHNPAQNRDRVVGSFDLDETKLYFISFAKKAEAFFNISCPIKRLRFSLRNLMSESPPLY